MKLTDWAKKQGIVYLTAWRWFKKGWLNAYQLPNGTIIIDENKNNGYKYDSKDNSKPKRS